MDRYVKNFIAASIFYLSLASVMGIVMLIEPELAGHMRFPHSHLMLLGWVSMMIYGVGYHILPRFAGKLIKNPVLPETQFYLANLGLLGMIIFQPLYIRDMENVMYLGALGISGVMELASSLLFFGLMLKTVYSKVEAPKA